MGAKVKTVTSGGGNATGVANDFNSFLRQGLNNGSFGAVGQTQGIGNTINTLLAGNGGEVRGMDSFNDVMSRFAGQGSYQAPQISNPLNGVTPIGNAGNLNLGQGLGSNPNVGGLGNFNIPGREGGIGYSLPGGGIDLSGILSQVGSRALLGDPSGGIGNAENVSNSLANRQVNTSGMGNTSEFAAIQQALGNQLNKGVADVRERYGVSSSGLHAENALRSQAMPELEMALSNAAARQRGLGQTDVGLGLQANQTGLQGLLSSLGIGLDARGQDLNNALGSRSLDQGALGLASNQSLQSIANLLSQRQQDLGQAGLNVEQRGQDISAGLSGRGQDLDARGQDINALLQSRGFDINQLGMLAQNQQANRGFDISSILGQAGLGLQGQMANQDASLQGQGLLQSLLSNYGQLGLGGAQLATGAGQQNTQNQLGALQALLAPFMQSNQLGTPQAQTQTYQQQSGFGQFLSGATGLLGGLGNLASAGGLGAALGGLGGIFGLGGGGGSGNRIPDLSSLMGLQLPKVGVTPSLSRAY